MNVGISRLYNEKCGLKKRVKPEIVKAVGIGANIT